MERTVVNSLSNQYQLLHHILYLEGLLEANGIPFQSLQRLAKAPDQASSPTDRSDIDMKSELCTNLRPELLPRNLIERYSRQMLLKEIQLAGQLKLSAAKIAIIGCGGIGCPLAMYLAAAGIGTIGLFDSDCVEPTNLHRQVGHRYSNLGMNKSLSLKQTIKYLNSNVQVETYPFVEVSTLSNLNEYTLVLDGSDNPKCRYLVNDYCQITNKVLLSGACIGWEGQVTSYGSGSACYRCLWGNDEISAGGCSTRGVIGMLPGIVAMIVAIEALKILTLNRTDLQGYMVLYDGLSSSFKKVKLRQRRADCIACGHNPMRIYEYNYGKYETLCTKPPPEVESISWKYYIARKGLLLDVRSEAMFNIARIYPSFNIPYDRLKSLEGASLQQRLAECIGELSGQPIYVSCRRGNDSRRAVDHLVNNGISAINILGGIEEYGRLYDLNIPHL